MGRNSLLVVSWLVKFTSSVAAVLGCCHQNQTLHQCSGAQGGKVIVLAVNKGFGPLIPMHHLFDKKDHNAITPCKSELLRLPILLFP